MNEIEIGNRSVGENHPLYIIAEGGLTNWGDVDLAKQQVDIAMAAGADAIKFQAQSTEELVSRRISPYWYKRLKYKELSYDELKVLNDYCAIRNIDFSVTAHTYKDLEFVTQKLDMAFLKIGSGESLNHSFLKAASHCGKPLFVSVGLHFDEEEILKTVEILEASSCKEFAILFCNTVYPTPVGAVNLPIISKLKNLLPYPIGYSDHTVGTHIPLAAVVLGAKIVEKHISFNRRDRRSFDCVVSCEADEYYDFVSQLRDVEAALTLDIEQRKKMLKEARSWARQSIMAANDLPEGKKLTREDIICKRPGDGLGPHEVENVLGKTLCTSVRKDEYILLELLQ